MKKAIHFTVQGRGSFPLDMLRYDACWPSSQAAVTAILESLLSRVQAYDVDLTSFDLPTEARWLSFQWQVIRCTNWGVKRQARVGGGR